MDKEKLIPSKVLELELIIKLLEYLKVNKTIDEGMYNCLVNKTLNKINLEKIRLNNNKYNIADYKLIT